MKKWSPQAERFFERCGRRGGKKRAKTLSPSARSAIAAHAASVRWGAAVRPPSSFMPSIRLEEPSLNDPVYLEEILSEGAWKDWRALYRFVADKPFGSVACALEKVCASVDIYGAVELWSGILRSLRGGADETEKNN